MNVEPRPGCDQTRTSPPWFCTVCLTMLRPSPEPPVLRERAWSTRKKRSKTRSRSSLRNADALVGDGDLDRAVRRLHADADAAAVVGVGDRVRDQVVHGDDQQRPVAVDLPALRRCATAMSMSFADRDDAVLVDRLGDDSIVDAARLGAQGIACLQPGELDDLARDVGEAGRLDREAPGEPPHLLGLVGRRSSASASRLTEAIGVFSSWLMLATKSRRTSSRRYASVRSSASSSTKRVPRRATRTRSRCRDRRTARARAVISSAIGLAVRAHGCRRGRAARGARAPLAHEPEARAPGDAFSTLFDGSSTTPADSQRLSTWSTPSGMVGGRLRRGAPRRSATWPAR